MRKISNLPSKAILRLLDKHERGSELWILYKGTLLYRHWIQLHGMDAANEMHDWWMNAWTDPGTVDVQQYDQLTLNL